IRSRLTSQFCLPAKERKSTWIQESSGAAPASRPHLRGRGGYWVEAQSLGLVLVRFPVGPANSNKRGLRRKLALGLYAQRRILRAAWQASRDFCGPLDDRLHRNPAQPTHVPQGGYVRL